MDINNILQSLKSNNCIGIHVENNFYILFDAKNNDAIEKYNSYKQEFILILESSNRLESYVQELNPLVYDLIEYSEKPIVLKLSGIKNINEAALQEQQSINIRIIKEGFIQQLIRKYRLPIIMCKLDDAEISEFSKTESIDLNMEDAFAESSLIRLEANGGVEILRK